MSKLIYRVKIINLHLNRQFLYAVALLAGTMVGVGVFGIPISFSRAGFLIGTFFLVFIGLITVILNLMYGEVVLRTQNIHQITGYAETYLGDSFKKVAFFATALATYAALLIYIIIAGEFLNNIFSFFIFLPSVVYSYIFFFVASLLVLAGIKSVSWVELALALMFTAVVLAILIVGWPQIQLSNLTNIGLEFWFLPYGILLFAFAGFSAIPIQRDVLGNRADLLKSSIITAVCLVTVLYFIFAFSVVGVSGGATTPDAVSGLYGFLGGKIVFLGSFFGLLAVSTSFLMLGTAFVELFRLDYGLSGFKAWSLTIIPPLVLFWVGMRAFVEIMGLAGSVAVGFVGIIIILVYAEASSRGDRVPEYSLELPKLLYYFLMLVFLAGIIYELVL